ncbi:integrase [Nocardia puris]|uniref:integrase n=1 Tax=Nocardia puris TaxID=208602 RepID=UPI0018960DE1|nr:integrase [Nocardia puris]MBF6216272.1 integrase [Nocardia puris]MBF6368935.1 integrase [Nocardia puris]MBF6462917.1 integrase [Nocardia puris]
MTSPLHHGRDRLIDPHPATAVLPAELVRPGITDTGLPRFGDASWQLSYLNPKGTAGSTALNWNQIPARFRNTIKRLTWALLNIPTPDVILTRPGSTTRPRLTPSSIQHTVKAWKQFATWLESLQITRLADVDTATLADYAVTLRDDGRSRNYAARQLMALTRIWAYSPHLLPADRIPMPPWDEYGVDDYLVAPENTKGRNRRVPIHPATMSPLLVWALRFVTDLAADIFAARDARAQLLAHSPSEPGPDDTQILKNYFDRLRATGQPIPGTGKPLSPNRRRREPDHDQGRHSVDIRYIASVLGIHAPTAQRFVSNHLRRKWPELTVSTRADLAITITGRVNDRRWVDGISLSEVPTLLLHLNTACLIVIAYLSGMRPEEVLHLQHGCCTPVGGGDNGTVRYRIAGRHFKGVTDEDGNTRLDGEVREHPWTVIAPVAAAIAALEQLTEEGGLLFPAVTDGIQRTGDPGAWRGDGLTPGTAANRIERFITFVNNLADQHGRHHEFVPADPAGGVVMSRFRQTVGWFINRLPGGRVALGIQYGHLELTMSEGYGSRAGTNLLEVLDFERARTLADTLAQAADRLSAGEHVSGPAAERYKASAAEFQHSYQGKHLSDRQHRAILNNPRLRVFDHEDTLLACNHNPLTALCDPDRGKPNRSVATPSFDRCKAACANIARTDTHIDRARREIASLQDEIDSGLNPHPIQQRQRQRQQALLHIIDQHDHGNPDPTPTEPHR